MDYCETTGRSETNGKNENIIPGDKSTYKEHVSSLSNKPRGRGRRVIERMLKNVPISESSAEMTHDKNTTKFHVNPK